MPTDTMILEAIHSTAQKQDITGLKLNTCQQRIYNTMQANPNKPINVKWPKDDGITQLRAI